MATLTAVIGGVGGWQKSDSRTEIFKADNLGP